MTAVVAAAAIIAVVDLVFWTLSGIPFPLFWDDAYMVSGARDLTSAFFRPADWSDVLHHHPPSAFAVHAVLLAMFPSSFAQVSHLLQACVVAVLLVTTLCTVSRREGRLCAILALGLLAAWPIVSSGAQQIVPDLAVGTLGLVALVLALRDRWSGAVAAYAAACALKLTAVGFFPALAWLAWGRGTSHRGRIVVPLVLASTVPVVWLGGNLALGHKCPLTQFALNGSTAVGFAKHALVAALRHLLEIGIYDGRWALSLAILVSVVQGRAHASKSLCRTLSRDRQALGLTALGVFAVGTIGGGTISLQRYLLPLAVPLAWLIAPVLLRQPSVLSLGLLTLALLQGVAIAHGQASWLTNHEEWIFRRLPGLGRSIDSTPASMRDFVSTTLAAVRRVESRAGSTRVGADWPAHFALTEPAYGYVEQPVDAVPWRPPEPVTGLDLLWIDRWRAAVPPVAHVRREDLGRRFPVTLLWVRPDAAAGAAPAVESGRSR